LGDVLFVIVGVSTSNGKGDLFCNIFVVFIEMGIGGSIDIWGMGKVVKFVENCTGVEDEEY